MASKQMGDHLLAVRFMSMAPLQPLLAAEYIVDAQNGDDAGVRTAERLFRPIQQALEKVSLEPCDTLTLCHGVALPFGAVPLQSGLNAVDGR